MKLIARVPATVANLGPGFDCFGLALDLCNEVTVSTGGEPTVSVRGEGAGELPQDGSNLILRAMRHVADAIGGSLPEVSVDCLNRIPLERGLGSSAAAVVAGVVLADRVLGADLDPDRILELAIDAEGHPDNVAAALRGGLTLAYRSRAGWRAETMAPSAELRPVVLISQHERLKTLDARRALPADVPLGDAAFNAGRAALAVLALTQRPVLLREALQDRLHEPFRLPLVPATAEAFRSLREAGFAVCVAGAGPSLLAFESEGRTIPDPGPGWQAMRIAPRTMGAAVEAV